MMQHHQYEGDRHSCPNPWTWRTNTGYTKSKGKSSYAYIANFLPFLIFIFNYPKIPICYLSLNHKDYLHIVQTSSNLRLSP